MDQTLNAVVRLIADADVEVRCAALVVLTRLATADAVVIAAAAGALQAKNAVVRDFALTYFERVLPRGGLAQVLPLLDSDDDSVRQRAVTILAGYGAAAVIAVRKSSANAPRRRLYAAIDLCARVRSSAAFDLLFECMAGADFDANRLACDAVLALVPGLEPPARADLFDRSVQLLTAADGQRPALVAAAKLLGALADKRARQHLLPLIAVSHPQPVRTHTLAALMNCLRGQKLTATETNSLLGILDEDDEAGILRPAIHLLEDQPLDRTHLARLNQLAESPQPVVKRFAVQKLGSFDSGSVVKTLIGYLTDDSYARRDQSGTSLKALPAARTALMKEFLACADERKAWTLADILLAHERNWKRDIVEALERALDAALEKREDRLFTAYFHFLNGLDPDRLAAHVRSQAERARKAKAFPLSAKWLSLLKGSAHLDAEGKFALAVAELKSHRRTVATPTRRHDPALELLQELARSPFSVFERLRKERSLTPEELFYVAFNCAEGHGDERALARDLLQHLAAKHSRAKLGKAAKNKLRLMGAAA